MAQDDTQRQLGVLLERTQTIADGQAHANDRRADLHRAMEALNDQVAATNHRLDTLHNDVAEMKPVVEMIRGLHGKVVTAFFVVGSIGGFIWWAGTTFWDHIRAFISGLK